MKRPNNVQEWMERWVERNRAKMFNLIEFELLDYILDLERYRDGYKQAFDSLRDSTDRLNEDGRVLARWMSKYGRDIGPILDGMAQEILRLEARLKKYEKEDNDGTP